MTKPRTEADLSALLDTDLTLRLRELSDIKRAILDAPETNRTVLLKALVALAYANWEGYVKYAALRYFEFLTLRRLQFSQLNRQFFINSFLNRLGTFSYNKPSLQARAELVADILSGADARFSHIHPDLISTGSNLNSSVLRDICLVCGIEFGSFSSQETFIDVVLLKRRNAIAHGDDSVVAVDEMDSLVSQTIGLMRAFKNELENVIYTKSYLHRP